MAKLTEVQLAALDLLIAKKKETAGFIDDVVRVIHDAGNVAEDVAKVTAAAAAVTAIVAGAEASLDARGLEEGGLTLEKLMQIRTKAIEQ